MDKYVIAVDVGTQSLRACLLNQNGENIEYVEKRYTSPFVSKKEGFAEVEPDFYMNYLVEVLKTITNNHQDKVDSIIALSVVTIRDTVVFLEEKDGKNGKKEYKPLYNIIHWADQRATSKDFVRFPFWMKAALKMIGLYRSVSRIATVGKTNWMRENEKELWAKTDKVALLSAYMNYRLTGNLVETRSCLLGHLPFNSKKGEWDKEGSIHSYVFPDTVDKMVPLIDQNEIVGTLTKEVAALTGLKEGLKVYSPGTDKALEQVGQGAIHDTDISLSFGSAASVEVVSDHYFEAERFIPLYRSALPGLYTPDYQIYRGYWMLNWFAKEFAFEREWKQAEDSGESIESHLDDLLEHTPATNNGLYMLPYWGEGIKTVGARGALIGFNDTHTRAHIYRAFIEGINYELYEGYVRIKKRGGLKDAKVAYISGGGAKSDKICQMTADMFGVDVVRGSFRDASLLGAGIAAFVYEKEYDSFENAVNSMIDNSSSSVFTPDSATHKLYKDFYDHIYKGTLSSLYKRFLKIDSRFSH